MIQEVIADNARIKRSLDIIFSNIGEEIVMMDTQSGEYFHVKNTAFDIWQLLETPTTFGLLCGQLSNFYDASMDVITTETSTFMREMEAASLVIIE